MQVQSINPSNKTVNNIANLVLRTGSTKDIVQEATSSTPFVKYTSSQRRLVVIGSSTSEDAVAFFNPFVTKVYDDLFERGYFTLEFSFTQFGPKTAKVLFSLFENLKTFKSAGKSVDIVWNYRGKDENMRELGAAFSELFELNFNLIAK